MMIMKRVQWRVKRGSFSMVPISFMILLLWSSSSFPVVTASSLPGMTGQLSTDIPSLSDVLEMAQLSRTVYAFQDLDGCPNNTVMSNTNSTTTWRHHSSPSNSSSLLPPHIKCHWYHHDHDIGTQVLVVSSQVLDYVAVVFAGTDDLKSLLTDGDILMRSFGLIDDDDDDTTATLLPTNVKIHAGFAHGLLQVKLMQQIQTQVEQAMMQLHQIKQQNHQAEEQERKRRLRGGVTQDDDNDSCNQQKKNDTVRLFTTGHSLGAADSVLTAVALTLLWNQSTSNTTVTSNTTTNASLPFHVNLTSINFGCPQTGNYAWRQAVHEQLPLPNPIVSQLGIWRLVLGLDLVPRLPTTARPIVVWQQVGHTMQLRRRPNRTECYYLHYGSNSDSSRMNETNETSYAGVPISWSTTPFVIIPSALYSHSITRYLGFLQNKSTNVSDGSVNMEYYCNDFVKNDIQHNDSDHHHVTPDDDFWIQPPKASPMMMRRNLPQPAVILPRLLQQEQELEGIEHVAMDME